MIKQNKVPSQLAISKSKVPSTYDLDVATGLLGFHEPFGCNSNKGRRLLGFHEPLDVAMARKEAPKLAMQMSRPFVLASYQSLTGFKLCL